ncbi:MAG: hypothetical protein U0271_34845 [Polyangiaceae bacterium]
MANDNSVEKTGSTARLRTLLIALGLGAAAFASTGCYRHVVVVDEGEEDVVVEDDYEPVYYDDYVVYYDSNEQPYYYVNGSVVYVTRDNPRYHVYVDHYARHRVAYRRWEVNVNVNHRRVERRAEVTVRRPHPVKKVKRRRHR